LATRRERGAEAKEQLAIAALNLIHDGQVLLLDGGTTADSDDVGRAFRTEVGHLFRFKSAGRSD
jgi:hypothetical protein